MPPTSASTSSAACASDGASVRAVMTRAAAEFVTPLSVGGADQRARVHRALRSQRRARDRPHPPVARGRSDRRRAGHRRPARQDGRRPRRRSRHHRAARNRQAGAGRAGHEPAHVAQPRHAAQRRAAEGRRRPLRRPQHRRDGRARRGGPGAPRRGAGDHRGRARDPCRRRSALASRVCARKAARSPAATCWSPAGRRTSRSIRCATSPIAPPASRATPSPRPRRASARASR